MTDATSTVGLRNTSFFSNESNHCDEFTGFPWDRKGMGSSTLDAESRGDL